VALTSDSQNPGVCVYSFHPLVLRELERVFADDGITSESYRLDSSQIADLRGLSVPPAAAYVVEANARKQVTRAIVGEVLSRYPDARLLVVAEDFDDEEAFPLLRYGAKGLLRYAEVSSFLILSVREVAAGGFWVSRTLLSRFVDSAIVRRPRLVSASSHLSRREREVHEFLMENFSNKEIASRLHMSERTVKFHVSNLLNKHGVRRRADLILLSISESRPA